MSSKPYTDEELYERQDLRSLKYKDNNEARLEDTVEGLFATLDAERAKREEAEAENARLREFVDTVRGGQRPSVDAFTFDNIVSGAMMALDAAVQHAKEQGSQDD